VSPRSWSGWEATLEAAPKAIERVDHTRRLRRTFLLRGLYGSSPHTSPRSQPGGRAAVACAQQRPLRCGQARRSGPVRVSPRSWSGGREEPATDPLAWGCARPEARGSGATEQGIRRDWGGQVVRAWITSIVIIMLPWEAGWGVEPSSPQARPRIPPGHRAAVARRQDQKSSFGRARSSSPGAVSEESWPGWEVPAIRPCALVCVSQQQTPPGRHKPKAPEHANVSCETGASLGSGGGFSPHPPAADIECPRSFGSRPCRKGGGRDVAAECPRNGRRVLLERAHHRCYPDKNHQEATQSSPTHSTKAVAAGWLGRGPSGRTQAAHKAPPPGRKEDSALCRLSEPKHSLTGAVPVFHSGRRGAKRESAARQPRQPAATPLCILSGHTICSGRRPQKAMRRFRLPRSVFWKGRARWTRSPQAAPGRFRKGFWRRPPRR
jgi:hypothetical protein